MKLKRANLFMAYLLTALSIICVVYLRIKHANLTSMEFTIEYWPLYIVIVLSSIGIAVLKDQLESVRNENLPR